MITISKRILLTVIILTFVSATACTKKNDSIDKTAKQEQLTGKEENDLRNEASANTKTSDTVFFGQWRDGRVIIEDYYKYKQIEEEYNKNPDANSYDKYGEGIKSLLKKYADYNETKYEYYINEYKPEFADYTNLKQGTKIYISTSKGIYPTKITGYYINLDDMIGSGAIFYATADLPHEADVKLDEIVVCSFNEKMSNVNSTPTNNKSIMDAFKGYLVPKLKDIKIKEYDNEKQKEVERKFDKIKDDEIKIFKGSFTKKGAEEYLVGVTLRNDFTNFTSLVYIMDENGTVLNELAPLTVNNFTYSAPYAIVDFNGDGVYEIITDDGYYEGSGYNFHKLEGNTYKVLTTGFVFGV